MTPRPPSVISVFLLIRPPFRFFVCFLFRWARQFYQFLDKALSSFCGFVLDGPVGSTRLVFVFFWMGPSVLSDPFEVFVFFFMGLFGDAFGGSAGTVERDASLKPSIEAGRSPQLREFVDLRASRR